MSAAKTISHNKVGRILPAGARLPFFKKSAPKHRKTSSEAPLRQALASKLPKFENIIKTIPNNIEAKDNLTMWGDETWQLLR